MKYEDSGVNIDKANEATKGIAKAARTTWGPGVLSEVGHFGGLFELPGGYDAPVLVSSVDGVGTKLMVAHRARRYDTIGQDLVNHCVNDILVQGARPLFFLDYIAVGRLVPAIVVDIVGGLSRACRQNGCALIGGETAEMPGLYQENDFDLAGMVVGVVERDRVIDGASIEPGDRVFALPSCGLHTNGYSLARKVFFETLGLGVEDHVEELGCTVGEELLKVHVSYLSAVTALAELVEIKGLAHITGGGIVENLPRVLPAGCAAKIDKKAWPSQPVFDLLRAKGKVSEREMFRVFNMGVGMLLVVDGSQASSLPGKIESLDVYPVGEITSGAREIEIA